MKKATKLLIAEMGLAALVLACPFKQEARGTYQGPTSSYVNKDKADGLIVENPMAKFAVKNGAYLTDEKNFPASQSQLNELRFGKQYEISQLRSLLFNYSTKYSALN